MFLRQESLTPCTTISPLAFILHIQIWDIIMVFKVRSGHINHLILLLVSVIRIFPVVTRTSQVRPSGCKHPITAHTTGRLPFSLCGLYLEVRCQQRHFYRLYTSGVHPLAQRSLKGKSHALSSRAPRAQAHRVGGQSPREAACRCPSSPKWAPEDGQVALPHC